MLIIACEWREVVVRSSASVSIACNECVKLENEGDGGIMLLSYIFRRSAPGKCTNKLDMNQEVMSCQLPLL